MELPLQIGPVRREVRLIIVSGLSWRPMQVLITPLPGLRHRKGALLMRRHLLGTRSTAQALHELPRRVHRGLPWAEVVAVVADVTAAPDHSLPVIVEGHLLPGQDAFAAVLV